MALDIVQLHYPEEDFNSNGVMKAFLADPDEQ